MKKILAFLFVAVLFAASCEGAVPQDDIIILYTNDVHCGIDDVIGYAGVSAYRQEMQKVTPYVILADAGDWASGGTIGTISLGGYIVEIMNAVKYNVAVPGNHEFDFGMEQFKKLAASLDCGLTACNFRDLHTGELVLKPYKILEYGNVKVAFIGAATPDTVVTSNPSFFKDKDKKYIYSFSGENNGKKLYETIQNTVDEVRAGGADYVILVAHLGEYKRDVTEHWSAPTVVANTRGIDAVIDGHSHEVTPELKIKNLDGKDVIITQTGTKLNHLGKMTINKEGKISTVLLSSADVKAKDEKIVKLIEDIKAKYERTLEQKLSHADFDLPAINSNGEWLIRNGETGLCNLVTDAFLVAAAKTPTGKADIALLNSGGIRANIKAGDVTLNSVVNVLPFIDYICIAEVPGQSILDDLEIGARNMPGNEGGLLHVAGMTYKINTGIPTLVIMDDKGNTAISGDRRVCDVYVNGEPIDPKKIYKVISIDYVLLENGNGHVFKGTKMIEPPFSIAYEVLGDYVSQFETLPEKYKEPQGRIKIK
ncbi:MAG: bifunctional UDP-sugar hydrolase/5'-nucleotidase [Synergistales bacterium]|nr:bifunctional UDP-sugar hydrolase/5'-nucleotidase [Synergistales bacterium]MDY6401082.1 bifunctional UDP-sugar hydrolase/5'-nucleotidase [Synergistales bacterium]MDY6404675.1 bifunctional UDP-sugar hydrolase/5'-nucleotidase [Synergistales bacterium]MDY6410909.1 bifunctional UDP-sugar hydrolase/5'-nucleotidase [Synergistales bacterium]MDY6415120.1 bifunctional UDP-sugar hydrolase/5'-nucleotidase [Synergistales bacterium]